MLDLRTVVEKFPQSIKSRSQLASVLHDLYPAEKRAVNIALIIYDAGVSAKISELQKLDVVQQSAFVSTLVDEYGLQEQYAAEGIIAWAQAYNLPYAGVVQHQGSAQQSLAGATRNTHNPDAYAKVGQVVAGLPSDFELESVPGGVVIKKFRGFDETNLIIPNVINNMKVVGIGKAAYMGCSSVATATISDGIEFIEDGAFARCEKLENVIFPETLKRIGTIKTDRRYRPSDSPEGAFQNCSIKNIILPGSLTYLGRYTFSWCESLISVDLPSSITTIEDSTFSYCSSLKKVLLPEKLKIIGRHAFTNCTSLSEIRFPLTVEEIGESAFESCSLTSVVLNEGLRKLGLGAFSECFDLAEVVLPSTLETIEDNDWSFESTLGSCDELIVYCYSGTPGLEYARKKGYTVKNASTYTGKQ